MTDSNTKSQARTQRLAPFFLALICFILPFVEVSCQGNQPTSLAGWELALGKNMTQRNPYTGAAEEKHMDGNKLFLAGFVCVAIALVVCYFPGDLGRIIPAIAGVTGFLLLLAGKTDLEKQIQQASQGLAACHWGIGFFGSCILLLVGAAVAGFQTFVAMRPASQRSSVV